MEPEQPKDHFRFVLKWLKVLAVPIEPLELSRFGRLLYATYSVTFIVLFPLGFLVSQICEIPNSVNDFRRLTFSLGYIFSDSLGVIKVSMFFRKRRQIYDMCKSFERGRLAPNAKRGGMVEYDYVKAANRDMKIQALIFQLLVTSLILYRIVFVLNTETKVYKSQLTEMREANVTVKELPPLPFASYIPFPYDQGLAYVAASSFQVFGTWLFGVYISAIDIILGGFLIHSRAQLLILKNYISMFAKKVEEEFVANSKMSREEVSKIMQSYDARKQKGIVEKMPGEMLMYSRRIVKEYVVHHLRVINICRTVENEFSILILLQFIASSGMICFILYYLYDSEVGSSEFLSTSSFLLLMLYQLYRYCVCGNEVLVHSIAVADTVFETQWIAADDSIQKSFLLIMQRAQRPIELTAAKFVILSLQTFMTLVKTSASYFMFLRRMNEENEGVA